MFVCKAKKFTWKGATNGELNTKILEILEQRLTRGWEANREALLLHSLILSSFCWASAITHCRISNRIFFLLNDPILTALVMSSGESWLQSSALPHNLCVTSFSFLRGKMEIGAFSTLCQG